MTEILNAVGKVILVCAIIIGGCWFFKHRTRASIEQGDKSMDPTFTEGGYSVDTSPQALATFKAGDFVAYHVVSDAGNLHIGRVIGTQGNKIEITAKDILVNGVPAGARTQSGQWTLPETKVPRGCAYVLANDSTTAIDSKLIGPISYTAIVGTVQAPH